MPEVPRQLVSTGDTPPWPDAGLTVTTPNEHEQHRQASRYAPSAVERNHRHRVGPSLEEMRDFLLGVLPPSTGNLDVSDCVQINLSVVQARRLAVLLGWRSTPTTEDCSDDEGRLCCPNCSAIDELQYRVESRADYPARELFAARKLMLPDPDDGWTPDIDWWFSCSRCGIDFNRPADATTGPS